MECEILIPWSQDNNIGKAYNTCMKKISDWVCFFDHDVLQLNPNWYHILLKAISTAGKKAGWITGMVNATACIHQLCTDAPKDHEIFNHMRFAKRRYEKYGSKIQLVDPDKIGLHFSGFMIATHRKAWEDTGGFEDGLLGVDNQYHKALIRAGYDSYVIPGHYMYHLHWNKKRWGSL